MPFTENVFLKKFLKKKLIELMRASNFVFPSAYQIEIEPSLDLTSFRGSVTIRLICEKCDTFSSFSLHASSELEFSSILLDGESCSYSREEDLLTISCPNNKKISSSSVVQFDFRGIIDASGTGLYRNPMSSSPGLATQLFATYARRVFPCWDEPSCKATFDLTLLLDNSIQGHAFSNMPVLSHSMKGSLRRIVFHQTPKMSCYLLAIFVGCCSQVKRWTRRNIPISVVVPMGEEEFGEWAVEIATKSVDFFEDFFSIALPLPKVDLIGLESFLYGGMENWGLIFFSPHSLYVAKNGTFEDKRSVASVVAHEMAHNWFGNLVTIAWWNDLWLSEGFATFASWYKRKCVWCVCF